MLWYIVKPISATILFKLVPGQRLKNQRYHNEQHHRSVEARTWSKDRVQDQHTLCTHCREPPEQVSLLFDVGCWVDFTKSLPKLFCEISFSTAFFQGD